MPGDMKAKVLLVTEKPFAADAVTKIEKEFESVGYELAKLEKYSTTADVTAKIAETGAQALIVRSDKMTPEVMDSGKESLKLIVRAGAGVDTIDLNAATERDICVMNTPGQNSNAVAELAFGMMLTNARNHYDGSSGYELRGKSIALYGYGAVAKCMKRLADGFGMSVIAYDPFLKKEDIEATGAKCAESVAELFSSAEFVSLHIPATPQTTKSITKELLMSMPKNGVLVNTARAEVVDEAGMVAAFGERADLIYISDVAPVEKGIFDAVNEKKVRAFITPKKMGAQTSEANNNAGVAAAKQIVDFFEKGDKKFQVNKPGQTF